VNKPKTTKQPPETIDPLSRGDFCLKDPVCNSFLSGILRETIVYEENAPFPGRHLYSSVIIRPI
jgi:hypothetical protein